MEGNEEDFLLLPDHKGGLLLFLSHDGDQFLILWMPLCRLHILHLLLELLDPHYIPLDLVLNDPHSSVPDLVSQQELVKLCEIRIRLENIQKVQCEL